MSADNRGQNSVSGSLHHPPPTNNAIVEMRPTDIQQPQTYRERQLQGLIRDDSSDDEANLRISRTNTSAAAITAPNLTEFNGIVDSTLATTLSSQIVDGRSTLQRFQTRIIGYTMVTALIAFPTTTHYVCYLRQNCQQSYPNYSDSAMIAAIVMSVVIGISTILLIISYVQVTTTPAGIVPVAMRGTLFKEIVKRSHILDDRRREMSIIKQLVDIWAAESAKATTDTEDQGIETMAPSQPPVAISPLRVSISDLRNKLALMEVNPLAPCLSLHNLSLDSERAIRWDLHEINSNNNYNSNASNGGSDDGAAASNAHTTDDGPTSTQQQSTSVYHRIISNPRFYEIMRGVHAQHRQQNPQSTQLAPYAARLLLESSGILSTLYPSIYPPPPSQPSSSDHPPPPPPYYAPQCTLDDMMRSVGAYACPGCVIVEEGQCHHSVPPQGGNGNGLCTFEFRKGKHEIKENDSEMFVLSNGAPPSMYTDLLGQPTGPIIKWGMVHHCSTCKQCVYGLDHHCPWIGQCVGRTNHKLFLQFLFFIWVSTAIAGACLIRDVFTGPSGVGGGETNACTWVMLASFIFCAAYTVIFVLFNWASISAIIAGETRLEAMIRERDAMTSIHTTGESQKKAKPLENESRPLFQCLVDTRATFAKYKRIISTDASDETRGDSAVVTHEPISTHPHERSDKLARGKNHVLDLLSDPQYVVIDDDEDISRHSHRQALDESPGTCCFNMAAVYGTARLQRYVPSAWMWLLPTRAVIDPTREYMEIRGGLSIDINKRRLFRDANPHLH